MVEVVLILVAVTALVAAFGAPLVLALTPEPWRPWWPVTLGPFGLAALVALAQPLGAFLPMSAATWVALGLVVVLVAVAVRHRVHLPRPSPWCLGVLAVAAISAGLAYTPSLHDGFPRPAGTLNLDATYYLSVDAWIESHPWTQAPPRQEVDGFYAPARVTWELDVRIGVDLLNTAAATVLGRDPVDTLAATTALLIGLGAVAVALLLVTLRAPPWAVLLGALLAGLRPETIRIGLDSYVAQAAGLALAPVALAAVALALRSFGWRPVILAGLLVAGLIGYYVEYAPMLVVAGVLLVAVGTISPAVLEAGNDRWAAIRRGAAIAGAAIVVGPIVVVRGVISLSQATGERGEEIVPFYGVLDDLAFVVGPFNVVRPVSDVAVGLGVAAALVAITGAIAAGRRASAAPLACAGVAVALFALHQGVVAPYSYGLTKVLSLAAPFAFAGLALLLASPLPRLLRGIAALVVAAVLCFDAVTTIGLSRAAIAGETGMISDDDRLRGGERLLGPRDRPVALDGMDLPGTNAGRQHFGVYVVRRLLGRRAVYSRGQSYFALGRESEAPDRSFSPDYATVLGYGPSLTHDRQVAQLGGWTVFRRDPVDVLLVSSGWQFAQADSVAGPFRWSTGRGELWLAARRTEVVTLALRVKTPGGPRRVEVVVGGRTVARESIAANQLLTVVSRPFRVPRGRTIVTVRSGPIPGQPPGEQEIGIGLVMARATIAAGARGR